MNSLEIDIPWQEKNKFSCHVIVKNILKHVIDYIIPKVMDTLLKLRSDEI